MLISFEINVQIRKSVHMLSDQSVCYFLFPSMSNGNVRTHQIHIQMRVHIGREREIKEKT